MPLTNEWGKHVLMISVSEGDVKKKTALNKDETDA
jgi:hypothetical protein